MFTKSDCNSKHWGLQYLAYSITPATPSTVQRIHTLYPSLKYGKCFTLSHSLWVTGLNVQHLPVALWKRSNQSRTSPNKSRSTLVAKRICRFAVRKKGEERKEIRPMSDQKVKKAFVFWTALLLPLFGLEWKEESPTSCHFPILDNFHEAHFHCVWELPRAGPKAVVMTMQLSPWS